jgi:AbrB family looped-hinge helix DNA binding protein
VNQRSSGPNGPPGESSPYSLTSRIGAKGQVVIPKSIRDCAGLRPGDEVEMGLDGDAVVLTMVRPERQLAHPRVPKRGLTSHDTVSGTHTAPETR